MIAATRRWFRRNRTNLLVGAGVIGAGYLAGQYVLGRIREASQRMREDKRSKDNIRLHFQHDQEACTYTVLALLPTIRDEIIGALPVEQITEQLQQERQERLKRLAASEAPSSEYPSAPPSIAADDVSSSSFIHTSQMGMSLEDASKPKRSKAQLWQDMKINSIARALSLIYTLALLTLLTRIQLNLLGRRTYLSSVVSMASPPPMQSSTISLEDRDGNPESMYGNDFETNRMYLTFSWWILYRGAKSILDRVMVAVKDVFGQVNIREDMSMERLSELIIEVRRRVEGATEEVRRQMSWLQYLLPPKEEELFVIQQAGAPDSSDSASPEPVMVSNPLDVTGISPSLRRLLDETADLIESPTFASVLSHLLDAGFSHLVDVRIASEAFKTAIPSEGSRITELPDMKCKLAHILPVFCRQAHAIVVGSGELDAIAGVAAEQPVPNEYLALMDQVHDLEAFAAVIYSSNFEYEAVESPRIAPLADLSEKLEPARRVAENVRETVAAKVEQLELNERAASARQTVDELRQNVSAKVEQLELNERAASARQAAEELRQNVGSKVAETADSVRRTAGDVQSNVAAKIESLDLNQEAERAKQVVQDTQQAVSAKVEQVDVGKQAETARDVAEDVRETVAANAPQIAPVLDEQIDPIHRPIEDVRASTAQPSATEAVDPVDPLTESAVRIESSDVPKADFDSAWDEALSKGPGLKRAQTDRE